MQISVQWNWKIVVIPGIRTHDLLTALLRDCKDGALDHSATAGETLLPFFCVSERNDKYPVKSIGFLCVTSSCYYTSFIVGGAALSGTIVVSQAWKLLPSGFKLLPGPD